MCIFIQNELQYCFFHSDKITNTWKRGPFLGFVMRSVEEISKERQEDNSFANVTITRASCQHTHDLWGANNKEKLKEKVRYFHHMQRVRLLKMTDKFYNNETPSAG